MQNRSMFTHGYALLVGVGADLPVTVRDAICLHDILVDPDDAHTCNGYLAHLFAK